MPCDGNRYSAVPQTISYSVWRIVAAGLNSVVADGTREEHFLTLRRRLGQFNEIEARVRRPACRELEKRCDIGPS